MSEKPPVQCPNGCGAFLVYQDRLGKHLYGCGSEFLAETGHMLSQGVNCAPSSQEKAPEFAIASGPLPSQHWLFAPGHDVPPMGLRCGEVDPRRKPLEEAVTAAARYALRAATMNGEGTEDPDSLVQNMVVGLLGYHTGTGLSDERRANPDPVPPGMDVITGVNRERAVSDALCMLVCACDMCRAHTKGCKKDCMRAKRAWACSLVAAREKEKEPS